MVINQPFAIGDILFLEPMFKYYQDRHGRKPIVPIMDHLMWLSKYIESAHFVPRSTYSMDYDSISMTDPDVLPIRFANQIYRGYPLHDHHDLENMMLDKYRLVGLDTEMWRNIDLKFSESAGQELLHEVTAYQDDYVLINNHSQAGSISIPVNGIQMGVNDRYSLIDWYLVIMYAKEFHTVSTSTFYLLQAIANKFELKCKIFIYPRPSVDGLRGISQLKPTFNYTPMP